MTSFTNSEQWDNDYNLFFVDSYGKIALLCHFGWRLLPPTIAASKENLEKLEQYFLNLKDCKESYAVCPELKNYLDNEKNPDYGKYIHYFGEISSKGLYTYDSYDSSRKDRPYYQVTIPKKELTLNDLPEEIKDLLKDLRIDNIDFSKTSLIQENIVSDL